MVVVEPANTRAGASAGPVSENGAGAHGAFENARLRREWRTLEAMVRIYCRSRHHSSPAECPTCGGLLAYAHQRLIRCRFGLEKPTCANCPVHCYRPDRREQVREIMRFSGPRMLWRHPWLTTAHWLDSLLRKSTPASQS